jgi:2-polyprenyl-3-methyl-5-hydroxy-6-metoxy-1,4-benzoquinol methylase
MDYDPIKDRFGDLAAGSTVKTRILFTLLHIVFLRAWYVRRELRRQLAPNNGPVRMLDAGTGFGQFSYWVARRFPHISIDAVDIKEEYLSRARTLFSNTGLSDFATFLIDDLTRLKVQGPYDLILSVDVMEHIEDDEEVFRNFFRVLRPGGVVLINTPSDLGGSDVQEGNEGSFIGEHVRDGYNREELVDKLSRAGLKAKSSIYTYGFFGSLSWRLLVKWPMQILNFSWLLAPILPLYYLLVLPVGMCLNALDMRRPNERGTGLLVVAERPEDARHPEAASPDL